MVASILEKQRVDAVATAWLKRFGISTAHIVSGYISSLLYFP